MGWGTGSFATELLSYIENGEEEEFDNALDFSGGEAIAHKVWEELDADTLCERGVVIPGDPDDCIRALKKHEATGTDQMMVMMQTETVPHADVIGSIELWGKYIIPEFDSRKGRRCQLSSICWNYSLLPKGSLLTHPALSISMETFSTSAILSSKTAGFSLLAWSS